MDLISIIIPVYNIENYLPNCLDSVLDQTYQNLEIILVDDGSSDGTPRICDQYAQKDPRVQVIHKPNGGVCSARNMGMKAATGDYISFVDGDDWIDPVMYQTLYDNAVKYGADISCCGLAQRQLDGQVTSFADGRLIEYEKEQLLNGFFEDAIIKETMYGPCNKIFRAEVLTGRQFDVRFALGEDILFLFGCLEDAKKVVLDNQPYYQYLKRPQSATTSSFSQKRLDYIQVADILCEKCRKDHPGAFLSAVRWTYYHKLVILRNLNRHPEIKNKNPEFYRECLGFIRKYKKDCWSTLAARRKLDYYLVCFAPAAYRVLPI